MDSEPFDERIVVRVSSDLKRQLQEIAEDEETTATGAARMLIKEGIDSRQRIVEMEREYDHLLQAFFDMNQYNKILTLDLIETCVYTLESDATAEQRKEIAGYFRSFTEILTEDFNSKRRAAMVEKFKKLMTEETNMDANKPKKVDMDAAGKPERVDMDAAGKPERVDMDAAGKPERVDMDAAGKPKRKIARWDF